MNKISVKRVYDDSLKSDGFRVLVDRLWPRGVKKEDADIDGWLKDLTPPKDLIVWFHKDKEGHYNEFAKKYHTYLKSQSKSARELIGKHDTITLVTAVKDIDYSHIPTLKAFLEHSI